MVEARAEGAPPKKKHAGAAARRRERRERRAPPRLALRPAPVACGTTHPLPPFRPQVANAASYPVAAYKRCQGWAAMVGAGGAFAALTLALVVMWMGHVTNSF